jgi:hypothetical protein
MQPADDAQFIVSYINVAKSCAAASVDALRSFHSASSSDACHIACLQREGDSYSGQYVLFIFALAPLLLLQCTSSAPFAALTAAIDALCVAPLIVKRFRSIATSAPVDAREMVCHFTGSSAALFTVTHLDFIPSIPGNVDRALALLQHEVSSVTWAATIGVTGHNISETLRRELIRGNPIQASVDFRKLCIRKTHFFFHSQCGVRRATCDV